MSSPAAHAPHLHRGASTSRIMWSVTMALAPAAAWGVFSFGLSALRTLAAAVLSAAATELLLGLALRRRTLGDGSAVLTGLLVGLCMPPAIPLFVPVVASAFAIAVAKWAFGGLGANWANPALSGWLFAFLSWRELFAIELAPRLWKAADALSAATPLGIMAARASGAAAKALPASGVDQAVSSALGKLLGSPAALPRGTVDLLLGIRPGAIGEVSILLLGAGAIVLAARRIVAWRIPVSFLATVGLLGWAFGGSRAGLGLFRGDPVPGLLSGGLILGACFMATDPVTSPLEPAGMVLFGIGCGALTWLVRSLGAYPEGVAFAILLMNVLVPALDRLTGRRARSARGRNGRG